MYFKWRQLFARPYFFYPQKPAEMQTYLIDWTIESFLSTHNETALCSDEAIDLLKQLLHKDQHQRPSAQEALKHPYFKDMPKQEFQQDFPDQNDPSKTQKNSKNSHYKKQTKKQKKK